MGIFDFAKKQANSSRVLVVHVGSTSVVGSFVTYQNNKPKIEAVVSSDIAVLSDLTYAQFEREMQKALSVTLKKMASLSFGKPDEISVFLSSPWYASQVRTAKLNRDIPFLVTKQMLDDMVGKELKAFEDDEIKEKHLAGDSLAVIESKTVSVKLNGYSHDTPIGAKASSLELSLFLAVSPVTLQTKIKDSLASFYGHTQVMFCTFLTASFLISRDILPQKESYILLDIGGEITDVSVMRDGAPVQSISFPIGKNFLLRRLSHALKRSVSESATLCMLYMEGKVENTMKDMCAKILDEAKAEWLGAFQRTLLAMTNELSIPDTILLTVDQEIAPWFVELTSHEEFHQYALTEKDFKVLQLNAELFHERLSFAENVPRNPFVMIEALACISLFKKNA